MVEIPYRTGEGERWALVCVLLEHQTKSDWQVPLKTFTYAALYWEWQWQTWETASTPKDEFSLTPILPIVLHTGTRPWGSAKTLHELLGPPEAFHAFTPNWQPIFWELAKHSADELVNGPESFLQAMAIFKSEDSELEEAQQLFRRIFQKIDPLHDTGRVQWRDLLKLILGWAQNRRPNVERQSWSELSDRLETSADNQREMQAMAITIAQSLQQEARQEGLQEGLEKGVLRGKLSTLRRQGSKRFGPPNEQQSSELNALTDLDRLDRMLDHVNEVLTWADVFTIK